MIGPGAVSAGGIPWRGLCASVLCALLWAWQIRRPLPPIGLSSPPPFPCAPVARVVGGGFVSSPSPSVLSWCACSCGGHSGGFVPLGQLSHSEGVVSLWQLDSSAHSLAGPWWVFCHSGGLAAPLLVPHSRGFVGHSGGLAAPIVALHSRGFAGIFFLPASLYPPLRRPRPMAALRSRLVGGRIGGFPGVAPSGPCFPM